MPIVLTDEQKQVVRNIVKGVKQLNEPVQTMGGFAGTGKTTVTTVLTQIFPRYAACAFTGKAASVMRSKGMLNAQTIHSTIYYRDREAPAGSNPFRLKSRNNLNFDGFIVDEASMVGRDLHRDLLSFDLPIIFIGDHGQLEPVGSDLNVMDNPMFKLETIHRNAGEIAWFANHIRQGGNVWEFKSENKVQIGKFKDSTDDIIGNTDQVICAFNKFRVGVNNNVRRLRKYKQLIEDGERIICLRNNRELGIFNGMQATVKQVDFGKNRVSIETDDGELKEGIPFHPEQFGQESTLPGDHAANLFDYGYCITAHKSQGSEWGNVVVYEQVCKKWDHVRWAYTAASRAKDNLIWLCP